jgi:uncharacterized membrane protein YkoI
MKRVYLVLIAVLVVAGVAICIGQVATQKMAKNETELSIDQVPGAVKATILAEAQGGAVGEIEMTTKNAQVIYEADVVIGGQKLEVKVAANGTLLSKAADDEDGDDEEADNENEDDEADIKVALADVPEAVRATIAKEAAGAEVKEIEMETEDGQTIYSAEVVAGGQEVEFEISPDGTLLGREVDDEED